MKNYKKNLFTWITIIFAIIFLYGLFSDEQIGGKNIIFSDFLNKVDEGKVRDVVIQGNNISGHYDDGTNFSLYSLYYPSLIDKLKEKNVSIDIQPFESKSGVLLGILVQALPFILGIGIYIYLMKQAQGAGGKAMGFGKSKAKLLNQKTGKITFKDVAGIDEAREELVEIVDFLKDPTKFKKIGGKIPKGCLLVGQPGTGKTLLARAIAGEADVPFFSISGSDFVEMFVGVGASRVRDMFEQGKKNAPCIIFIDEIDAVGRNRGVGMGGGNDEREQTLNQLLVEMDGFEENEGVIIIAATNRPDVLDPALLRPGRFDRQIVVQMPDINGREAILKVHLKKVKFGPDVDPRVIARGTPGFSGAELQNIVNEAALLAARKEMKVITMREMEEAKDKIMMGSERRSLRMSENEKKLTAYHEGGHALIAYHQKASDPIHKATIIPRGQALGMVMRLPKGDQFSVTREKLKADLAVAMGGRVAEEIIFGYDKVTSGASSDIKYATKMAKAMVCEWGLSDKIGPIYYAEENRNMYLGGASGDGNKSSNMANIIDEEIKIIIMDSYNLAHSLLKEHIDELHLIANSLLKYETLSGEEINMLLAGQSIRIGEDHEEGVILTTSVPSSNNNSRK